MAAAAMKKQHDGGEDPDGWKQHRGSAPHRQLPGFLAALRWNWSPKRADLRQIGAAFDRDREQLVRTGGTRFRRDGAMHERVGSKPPPRRVAVPNRGSSIDDTLRATTRCTGLHRSRTRARVLLRQLIDRRSSGRMRSALRSIGPVDRRAALSRPQNPAPNATVSVPIGARNTMAAAVPPSTAATAPCDT